MPGRLPPAACFVLAFAGRAALAQPIDGATVFAAHCIQCHGAGGKGDGPAAALLSPAPHDLTSEPLRFAATGGSMDEVTRGLESTIARGLPRTGMPGYGGVLSKPEIEAVARHILSLGLKTTSVAPDRFALKIGQPPETAPALTARGATLFRTLACISCHGERGMGDGEGAKGLLDTVGRAIRPADLGSGRYMAGDRVQDLYRVILMGVPGTPMAGYKPMLVRRREGGVVDDWDAWAVVDYVKSLRREPLPRSVPSGADIAAQLITDSAALADPASPAWNEITTVSVDLFSVHQSVTAPLILQVRAATSAEGPIFRLEWADATRDEQTDGAAIVAAPSGTPPPLPAPESVPCTWTAAVHDGSRWSAVFRPVVQPDGSPKAISFVVWDGAGQETNRSFTAWHWLKAAP